MKAGWKKKDKAAERGKAEKTGREKKLRSMRVSTRLSLALGTVIFLLFIALNVVVITMSSKTLDDLRRQNLFDIADVNKERIYRTTAVADSVATTLLNSLEDMYSRKDYSELFMSNPLSRVLPDQHITDVRSEEENFILRSLWSVVQQNDDIIGAGVFFEKNAFQGNISEYAPYVNLEDAKAETVQNMSYSLYGDGGSAYYTKAKETGKLVFSDPYVGKLSGKNIVTAAYPILHDGKFLGTVVLDIDTNVFSSLSAGQEKYKSLYLDITNENDYVLYSSTEGMSGKPLSESVDPENLVYINELKQSKAQFFMQGHGFIRCFTPVPLGEELWWTQTAVELQEFYAERNRVVVVLILVELFIFISLLTLTFRMVSKALKPLGQIARAGKQVADGDFSVDVQYSRKDEIGELAEGVGAVMERVRTIIGDLSEKLNELAGGNFALDLSDEEQRYSGEYRTLLLALEEISADMSRTMREIQESSRQVNSGAEQVSSGAQALSQGATEQASSIQELSATMAEISQKIRETAEMSREASGLSGNAGEAVELSNRKMKELSQAMQDITERSNEIGKIIKTIDDIAFQTNILALNAAIEAARAGAAGKGFAVVADEVGNLAQKSAKAAQNTSLLIEETIEAVNRGARITMETGEALDSVSGSTDKVNGLIQEISSASEEEARGIGQLTAGLDQISSVVQTNSATAEESAAASEELSGQAAVMNDLVGRFHLRSK